MGTTLDAFNAGSVKYTWCILIEGYENIVTQSMKAADLAAVVTAYAGTDWTSAIGGAFIDIDATQEIDPWAPLASGGGNCTVHIMPDTADTFGVVSSKRIGGFETYLASTADRDDTTLTVLSTASFPSSGTIYIGTECITYTGTTATTFTGCTRGKYSPCTTSGSARFSHTHRVGLESNTVNLHPLVTSIPRNWLGRRVLVYAHRNVGGVLDTRAEALLMFAGRMDELRDDPNTQCRTFAIKHELESLSDIVIGQSIWSGTINEGCYIPVGATITLFDDNGTGIKTATSLVAVTAGTSSGANQMDAGYYTLETFASVWNTWIIAEKVATRVYGKYAMTSPATSGSDVKTVIDWQITPGSGNQSGWEMSMPGPIAVFLGIADVRWNTSTHTFQQILLGSAQHQYVSEFTPLRTAAQFVFSDYSRVSTTDVSGTFVDQYSTLPISMRPAVSGGLEWGLFVVDDSMIVFGNKVGDEILQIQAPLVLWDTKNDGHFMISSSAGNDARTLTIRQIVAFEGQFSSILAQLLLSTGTAAFNHATYDTLPMGYGAAMPYSLLGADFITSLTTLPTGSEIVIIERPTKFVDILNTSMLVRWTFPVWREGSIRFATWRAPSAALASATLADSNKAAPAGNKENHRSASVESNEWQAPIVKIRYNRDASHPDKDEYQSSFTLIDSGAIDAAGGDNKTKTIDLRNTFGEFVATGNSAQALVGPFLSLLPLITRPAQRVTRSIDQRYFHSIAVGDVVLFSDGFARDPETGARSVTERPALVVRHRWTPGGLVPGDTKPSAMTGEVDLFFLNIDIDRLGAVYAPSAMVLQLTGFGYTGGYDSSTFTLACDDYAYSQENVEPFDVTNLVAGDKVLIIERDPTDVDAPLYWERTVASAGPGTIPFVTLTAGLSSPTFDASKRYQITYGTYANATSTQKALKTYQADSGDGLIIDVGLPFFYGSGSADSTYSANDATRLVEWPASMLQADGAPRDVASEQALAYAGNNLIDYKRAIQCPMLSGVEMINSSYVGYQLVAMYPVHLNYEILSNSVYRSLLTSGWARSTDGTSTKLRITLSRNRPSFSTINDVPWSFTDGDYSQAEWTGITSTSASTLSEQGLIVNVKDVLTGKAWLSIEAYYKCATRGAAKLYMGPRLSI